MRLTSCLERPDCRGPTGVRSEVAENGLGVNLVQSVWKLLVKHQTERVEFGAAQRCRCASGFGFTPAVRSLGATSDMRQPEVRSLPSLRSG